MEFAQFVYARTASSPPAVCLHPFCCFFVWVVVSVGHFSAWAWRGAVHDARGHFWGIRGMQSPLLPVPVPAAIGGVVAAAVKINKCFFDSARTLHAPKAHPKTDKRVEKKDISLFNQKFRRNFRDQACLARPIGVKFV
ncbi:hypothetical protein GPALN_004153 [Globodera pallida]|nr:hypothetical protein GPALN_004153 [Globodera pallida]